MMYSSAGAPSSRVPSAQDLTRPLGGDGPDQRRNGWWVHLGGLLFLPR